MNQDVFKVERKAITIPTYIHPNNRRMESKTKKREHAAPKGETQKN